MAALAAAGGTAVVQAAGTDAWAGVRRRAAALLGRSDVERREAELVRLDQTEAGVTGEGDVERQRAYWESVWQARLEVFVEGLSAAEREGVAAELRALVVEAGSSSRAGQQAGAGGVVAGGDVSVRAEGGSVAGAVVRVDGGLHLAPPFPRGPQQ
ncbi:hypothetical protein ACF1A5_31440 [Streptomyces sp. NPDC014864]|uniref:hypothetical protein n=1 Tax=Streptomyces sp. NPDC014864 TaxID=3364924 RepID=UPI0036FF2B52